MDRRLSRRWLGAITVFGVATAGSVLAVVLASPASAATDLAVGRPASADSTEAGRTPAHGNDANAATRWCAANGNTGHWWQVDLGSVADLTGTQVVWEFARNYRYRIAVSTDGGAWTTVADRTGHTGTAQTQSDTFTARARFVRVTITGLAAGTWASFWTFSVFGTTPNPGQPYKGVANSACADLARLNASWYYNWWISPGNCTAPGFVPTISGKSEKTPGQVTWALNQLTNAGYRTVLGFNEPNKVDQSNLTVEQVVAMWPALTANPDVRVGSPATSGDGQAWFTNFMKQVEQQNLRVDFLAIHWYGWNAGSCDANAATLENYIRWAESFPGNRPIWITEFGCMNQSNPDPATVQRFYSAAVAMFARHPRIERHAWYPWLKNNELVATGGALTPLGQTLANAQAYR